MKRHTLNFKININKKKIFTFMGFKKKYGEHKE